MRQLSDSLLKYRYAKSIYRLTLCMVSQTYGFRERDLSFLTCMTRLTPQENVFLNISIYVCGDTLHGYGHSHFVPLTVLVFEIIICFPPALTYTSLISVQMTLSQYVLTSKCRSEAHTS